MCVCVRACARVCVCVKVIQLERERMCVRVIQIERVCVCVRERKTVNSDSEIFIPFKTKAPKEGVSHVIQHTHTHL